MSLSVDIFCCYHMLLHQKIVRRPGTHQTMRHIPTMLPRRLCTGLSTSFAMTGVFVGALRGAVRHVNAPDNKYVPTSDDATEEEKMIEKTTFVDVTAAMARSMKATAAAAAAGEDALVAQALDDAQFDIDSGALPPNRRDRPESSLTVEERRALSEMIYNVHYKSEARNGSDGVKAMIFQSALEVKFIEDAIEDAVAKSPGGIAARDAKSVRILIKKAVLERCDMHKPLSYIIGYQPYYGCHISCVQPLLCPRPETEMWCHWLVSHFLENAVEPFHVLDMCSGTGCVGISIAKHAPKAHVVAVDILPQAVEVSNTNAARNNIPADRYRCIPSDMFSALEASTANDGVSVPHGSVDLIVSNPPYILPNQYEELPKTITYWESKIALVGDEKRQDKQYTYFQDLCEKGAKFLKPANERHESIRAAPSLLIEIGIQGQQVASIIERHPDWMDVDLHTDFAGQPRWVTARRR